jgi:predicted enzyme related to lactoylglutathione lyase
MAMPKTEVPGVGWSAYLFSPTGIMFGMMQSIPRGEK